MTTAGYDSQETPSWPLRLVERLDHSVPRAPSQRLGLIGAAILLGLTCLALFPRMFAPYDPTARVGPPLQSPSATFRLGTNDIGQDILSELIWSTRNSLSTGLIVGTISVAVGTVVGLISGASSGVLGSALMRLADLTLVMPFLPLVIVLSAYLGPSRSHVVLVLSLVFWPAPARLVRARTLTLLNERYVDAARALGAGLWRTLWRHVWPGVRTVILTQGILIASGSILAEASLSFLGLGEPSAKSWGTMLFFARASGAFLGKAWRWWVLPTGLMITATVLGLVLTSYALEQRFHPQLRNGSR